MSNLIISAIIFQILVDVFVFIKYAKIHKYSQNMQKKIDNIEGFIISKEAWRCVKDAYDDEIPDNIIKILKEYIPDFDKY